MKKIFFSLLLTSLTIIGAIAADNERSGSRGSATELGSSVSNMFEYDAINGWWWYKQKVVDKEGKEKDIKTKLTTPEKVSLEKQMITTEIMKRQLEVLNKISERLDYAFPDLTPKYSKNSKGEKCLTNSSADCFVMPIQPEALHVPVLANWIADPSPKNSKEYLKWQAVYFNHLQKVSLGLRFSFLQHGAEAYPTDTTFAYGDSLSEPISEVTASYRKMEILKNLKDRIGIVIFMGGNTLLEGKLQIYRELGLLSKEGWKDINRLVVVPNENAKQRIIAKRETYDDQWIRAFWDNVKIEVRPDLFKRMNIMVTPSVVGVYKTEKGEDVFQTILTGDVNEDSIIRGMIQFLVYNGIVDPADMASSINHAEVQKNMKTKAPTIREDKIQTLNGDGK